MNILRSLAILVCTNGLISLNAQTDMISMVYYADQAWKDGNLQEAAAWMDTIHRVGAPRDVDNYLTGVVIHGALQGQEDNLELLHVLAQSKLPCHVFFVPVVDFLAVMHQEPGARDLALNHMRSGEYTNRFGAAFYMGAWYQVRNQNLSEREWEEWVSTVKTMVQDALLKDQSYTGLNVYLQFCLDLEFDELDLIQSCQHLVPLDLLQDTSRFAVLRNTYGFPSYLATLTAKLMDQREKNGGWTNASKQAAINLMSNYFASPQIAVLRKELLGGLTWEKRLELLSTAWKPMPEMVEVLQAAYPTWNPNQPALVKVWGTWCSPCVYSLPEYQKLLTDYDQVQGLTLSYGSTNLNQFMTDNQYKFSVAEVDNQAVRKMGVSVFPSTFWMFQDRVLKLPSRADAYSMAEVLFGDFPPTDE